jgi:uncharacterized membrane protein YkvA (DUF1232 family)
MTDTSGPAGAKADAIEGARTSDLAPTPDEALAPAPDEALVPTSDEAPFPSDGAAATSSDPFPRDAWSTLTAHAAGYLRLTLALLKDPAVSRHRRAALLAAAAYFASPIDLVPGIIPVLGQVDDLAVAILAIRLALNALEPGRRQMHLEAAGLSDETLREDLVATGRLAAWTARAGARTGLRVGRGAVRFTLRGGRAAADLAVRGGRTAGRTGAAAAGRAISGGRGLAERIRHRGSGRHATVDDPGSGFE